MQLKNLMTREVEVIHPNATLQEAAEKMEALDVGPLPVCDGDRLVGMITDRDIAVRAVADGRDPGSTTVDDVMSRDPVTLTPDQSVDDAIQIVREHNVRRVPVVQDGRPVGIVSIGDLAIERDEGSALADLSSSPPNN